MDNFKKLVRIKISGKDFEANGWYLSNRHILIEKGSSICKQIGSNLISSGKKERHIIETKYIDNYKFKDDYIFKSASACFSAISGVNDGPRRIHTEEGISLKEYINKYSEKLELNDIEESAKDYLASNLYKENLKRNAELEKKWENFLIKFSKNKIINLSLDEYCLGTQNYKNSFCYIMERGYLSQLGSIRNSTADAKFGIHYNKKEQKFTFLNKWGSTTKEAFKNIKLAICNLLEAGKKDDLDSIINNRLSEMFKSKIYYVYFKEKALPIYSVSQLDFFIEALNIPCSIDSINSFDKRNLLIEYKNDSPIFSKFSSLEFMQFLYSSYGFEKETTILKNHFKQINAKETIEMIYINDLFNKQVKGPSNKIMPKVDYESIYKNQLALGTLAETKVVQFEKKHNKKYANKITRLSAYTDSYHYDILSFDKDGNEKHIEVKAKANGSLENIDFRLSAKEYDTLKSDSAYMIYYVFGLKTGAIKIIQINKKLLDKIKLVPETYRIIASSIKNSD